MAIVEVNVTTAEELMNAIYRTRDNQYVLSDGGEESPYVTEYKINIMNDIDMNNSPYYMWDDNFFYTNCMPRTHRSGASSQEDYWIDFTIDGKGHTISNIYCFNNHAVFNINIDGDHGDNVANHKFTIKNLTVEAICNSSALIWVSGTYTRPNLEIDSCMFNCKIYAYNVWCRPGYVFSSRLTSAFIFTNIGSETYTNNIFVNCIFNFVIMSTQSVASNTTHMCLMYFYVYRQYYGGIKNTSFNGCIFKIRNNTDKALQLDTVEGVRGREYMRNCGIFYNEEGPYTLTNTTHYLCYVLKSDNTFFASFGNLRSDRQGARYIINVNAAKTNCFYDKNKLNVNSDYNVVGTMAALTTEQCKDRDKLSEIGYIFCEES